MSGSGERDREKWDARYRGQPADECGASAVVVHAADLLPPGEALDLACGLGRNAVYLAERGWRVTAVDISPLALDRIRHPAIRAVCADLASHQFEIAPASFDLIVDVLYLQRDLMPAIREGVRPGGLFAGEILMDDPLAAPRNAGYLLRGPGDLAAYFAHWRIELSEEAPASAHHRATTRFIARKTR